MLMNLIGFDIENLSYNWSIITYRNSNTNAVGVFHCIILVWLAVSIPVFVNVPVFVGGSIPYWILDMYVRMYVCMYTFLTKP